MKILRLNEIDLQTPGYVCRQSRFMAAVGTILLLVIFGALLALFVYARVPWPVWGFYLAFALFFGPLAIGNLLALTRQSNWLLWIRRDGLWINCRSYQDRSSSEHRCVLVLDYSEIAEVREHLSKYTTPGSDGGSAHYRLQSLEFELKHADSQAIADVLRECRTREQPQRRFLGIGIRSLPTHFAVSLHTAGIIRIAWRGGIGHWVSPKQSAAMAELRTFVRRGEAQTALSDWREAEGAELDDHILTLAQTGAKFDAIKILVERRGYSLTEAHEFVSELNIGVRDCSPLA